ncbi:MAG: GntR family transcriptional regulator [Firmicutes bacterium]|jgi:GntR family transcriptional regulator|nr:GntR family transcriptional regulator [Bacillota bacterium]
MEECHIIPINSKQSPNVAELVQDQITRNIRLGVLKPGQKLPSEPEYAAALGVSRNSLREALQSLEREGLVVRRHGIGTFVTESRPMIKGGIERLSGVMQIIADQGRVPGTRLIRFERAECGPEAAHALGVEESAPAAIIETVKTADGDPVAVCMDVIPIELLGDSIDVDALQRSVFEGLEKSHGVSIKFAECELVPTVADDSLAEKLAVDTGTPILLLSQVHVDSGNRRVLYSCSYFPFNRFTFRLIRHRS